jgi:hypothetical protein
MLGLDDLFLQELGSVSLFSFPPNLIHFEVEGCSLSERSPTPLRHATKKVRMISELLIMVQDSIYHQPGLTLTMVPISDQISSRTISRNNSSSSHSQNGPLQEHSPVHSSVQSQREPLVQEQDIIANVGHVKDGNETQPSLSSYRASSKLNSIREGKHARFSSVRRATHWKTVGTIMGFLFAG